MFHPEYIKPDKLINNSDILQLFRLVEKNGGVLRFVGGAVRDAIAGISRTDIDLVTDLSPSELAEICDEEGVKSVPIGVQFFTLGIIVNNSFFKVTSLSSDEDNKDNWQKDAANRDLTINAVYADEKGNVFDYYNGIDDLENGIIKFIGNPQKAIDYDYIRIMRFFRFCAMFGKKIDESSLKACVANKNLLRKVSVEKIKEELFKIILAPYAVSALTLLFKYSVLDFIINLPDNFDRLEKLINIVSELHLEKSIIRRLFILFAPNKQRVLRLSDIFKLTHSQKDHLLALSKSHLSLSDFKDIVSIKKNMYLFGKEVCRDMWICLNLDNENLKEIHNTLKLIEKTPTPIFPISGKDLIKNKVDINLIGTYIEQLKEKWLESGCTLTQKELISIYENISKK